MHRYAIAHCSGPRRQRHQRSLDAQRLRLGLAGQTRHRHRLAGGIEDAHIAQVGMAHGAIDVGGQVQLQQAGIGRRLDGEAHIEVLRRRCSQRERRHRHQKPRQDFHAFCSLTGGSGEK